jgi:hypothetical protein
MSVACGMQRSEATGDGYWQPAEPPCPQLVVYAVTLDCDDGLGPVSYGLCPEHTAWTRASWSGVTDVRQVARP